MLHAMMREMPDIERIGEIIEICQLVWNLELSGVFGHRNTNKARLLVDSKRHRYNVNTGVDQAYDPPPDHKRRIDNGDKEWIPWSTICTILKSRSLRHASGRAKFLRWRRRARNSTASRLWTANSAATSM